MIVETVTYIKTKTKTEKTKKKISMLFMSGCYINFL